MLVIIIKNNNYYLLLNNYDFIQINDSKIYNQVCLIYCKKKASQRHIVHIAHYNYCTSLKMDGIFTSSENISKATG